MLGVKAASLGKMGTHSLDGASHTDVTSMSEAKGDILVYTGSTWDKLAIGTNNKILIADSSTSTGLAWAEDITIGGDLTVSGDTITANVATIQVEDKNMELNKVGSPSDSNADGGGLTIKGTSDKTITFTNATGDFDFSENVDIASGKTFKVAGTTVLSNNTLGSGVTSSSLTELGTITTGVWNGTAIGLAYGGTGLVGATDGKIVVADGSGAPVTVQAMTANDGTFKHEVGGIEADISAIAKGGLVAGSGSGSMAIRTVGSNNHVLTADSSEATGMKWATAPSGAVTALNNATANELVTVGSTTTELDAEANLTFDGSGDLEIGAGSSGDPRITFDINSTDEWTIGVDDSDSDKFKIDTGATVGGATKFSLDSSGNAVIAGAITLGTTSFVNSDGVLQVAGQTNITSLGTLTALTVDDIGLDSKTVTMTGSSGDTATLVVAANGAFSINTNDAAAAAAHLTVDIDGDIDLDSHSGVLKISAAGTEILNISNSSSDVIIKPVVDEKDIIFQQRDGTEVARIEDNGTFNIVTDKLAINGTAVTSTAAELNILDGVTSTASELNILDGVTSTATELNIMDGNATVGTTAVADGDGIVTNDNGTMRQTTVQTFATYFGSEITAMTNLVETGALDAGSITSGFGTIDTGASAISTTGAVRTGDINLGHASDTTIARASAGEVTIAGDAVKKVGTENMWVPAQAMTPRDNAGCGALTTTAAATNGRADITHLPFDASTQEHAQFSVAMPKSWNEGTIKAQFYWTTTGSDTDAVIWGISGVSYANDNPMDVAFGTAVTVTDNILSAAKDILVTAETADVTIAGSPAAGEICYFEVFRDADNGSDTVGEDCLLIGVKIIYTTDTSTDA
jgi:hypothetical protein